MSVAAEFMSVARYGYPCAKRIVETANEIIFHSTY